MPEYLSPISKVLSLSPFVARPMLRNNPLFCVRVPEISSGPPGAIPLPLFPPTPELICKSPASLPLSTQVRARKGKVARRSQMEVLEGRISICPRRSVCFLCFFKVPRSVTNEIGYFNQGLFFEVVVTPIDAGPRTGW